jgi:NitT/TauT family transport system substrate-binding protein
MRLRLVLGLVFSAAVLLGGCAPSGSGQTGAAPTAAAPTAAAPTPTAASSTKPAAAATSSGVASTKVSIAYSNLIADNLALWTAKDSGVFTNNALDVDLQYIASTNAMSALLAGQVQVASTGGSEVINSIANGADLVVVATITPVYAVFLETRPEITSAEGLKGKSIAITNPGASFDVATRVLLEHEGLNPDTDVNFIKTGSVANVTAALISGNVDAGLANVPDKLKIEAAGLHPLFDMSQLGFPASTVVLVLQRSFVDGQHDAVQRLVDSVVEATARQKRDKPGTVELLKKYLQTDDQAGMEAAFDYYTGSVLPVLPLPKEEQFGDAQKTTSASNPRAKDVRVSSFIDPSFVQSSADRGMDKR